MFCRRFPSENFLFPFFNTITHRTLCTFISVRESNESSLVTSNYFSMPIIHCETCRSCPENSGLDEITARIIMDPSCSDATVDYAEKVVDKIPELKFQTLVSDLVADPTKWTIQKLTESAFGKDLELLSFNQLIISDVVTSHSVKNPTELLLTIEMATSRVSTYRFSTWMIFDKMFKIIQGQFSISSIGRTDVGFP